MRSVATTLAQTLRAARTLAADDRLPRPVRWLAGLAVLPIPGPFDEAVLLGLVPLLLVFYRQPMEEAWRAASTDGPPTSSPA